MSDTVKMRIPFGEKSVKMEIDKKLLHELEKRNIDVEKEVKSGICKAYPELSGIVVKKEV